MDTGNAIGLATSLLPVSGAVFDFGLCGLAGSIILNGSCRIHLFYEVGWPQNHYEPKLFYRLPVVVLPDRQNP